MAQLIIECKLFLWDEASMAKRDTIQAFDELLKDLMETSDPFGGKVVVFGGDFRQTLPVIQGATKDQLIQASLLHSSLWSSMHKIKLKHNMRAVLDPAFSRFLLAVGEGAEPVDADNQICLPGHMVIPFHNIKDSLDRLIAYTFPDLNLYSSNPYEMISRCILTPKNTSVEDINEMMIQRFPGQLFTYTSSDQTVDQRFQVDYEDFLNSQNPKGLPPHKLMLKESCPLILLRNLNPAEGLCNGTRLICRQLRRHTICAEIAFGQHKGKKIFIPRIPLQTPDNEKNGIPFIRRQFPVRLCFAMTINKAQGQTLDYVGVYLKEPVFSHGQLYVALSRAKTADAVKVLILPGTFAEIKTDCKTRNIVFDEILQLSN
nr:ATP-dependent DNA helicase PIF1-like [Coffea arabica]